MNVAEAQEALRALVEECSGCVVRWRDDAEDMIPDGDEAPRAVAYLTTTSTKQVGETVHGHTYNALTEELDVLESNTWRFVVTVAYESAESSNSLYNAFFYAHKAHKVLRRRETWEPFNALKMNGFPSQIRPGPTIEDNGAIVNTAALEIVWNWVEETLSTTADDRVKGANLHSVDYIEEAEAIGTTTDPIVPPVVSGSAGSVTVINPPFGGAGYNFSQPTPALVWTITHNLGYFPGVQAFTLGGEEVIGEVVHLSSNTTRIAFAPAQAGFARLI